ncbi:hypothetical protein [Streptomyces sp. SAS_281]
MRFAALAGENWSDCLAGRHPARAQDRRTIIVAAVHTMERQR